MSPLHKTALILILLLIMAGCQSNQSSDATGPLTESDLVGTSWTLSKMITYPRLEGSSGSTEQIVEANQLASDFTLKFDKGFLGGKAGCNSYRGSWYLDEFGRLTLSGTLNITNNCNQEDLEVAGQFLAVIQNVVFAELNNGVLEIKSPQAGFLFFNKE